MPPLPLNRNAARGCLCALCLLLALAGPALAEGEVASLNQSRAAAGGAASILDTLDQGAAAPTAGPGAATYASDGIAFEHPEGLAVHRKLDPLAESRNPLLKKMGAVVMTMRIDQDAWAILLVRPRVFLVRMRAQEVMAQLMAAVMMQKGELLAEPSKIKRVIAGQPRKGLLAKVRVRGVDYLGEAFAVRFKEKRVGLLFYRVDKDNLAAEAVYDLLCSSLRAVAKDEIK